MTQYKDKKYIDKKLKKNPSYMISWSFVAAVLREHCLNIVNKKNYEKM